ncbi:MAG: beta-lactamase family protein [Acidimicrobiales bacterium]|nr:beta-lactamase family protein [Acidimicrobiales bacterium]
MADEMQSADRPRRRGPHGHPLLVVVALAVATAVAVAACGSDDDTGGEAATSTTAAGTTSESGPALDAAAITDTVDGLVTELQVPGAVVLVRKGDDEVLEAFGTRSLDGDDVTVDDHFRVGSNTKTWTGTVLLQLVDEGLVALDDPIADTLPDVPGGDDITVAQLLDMRSGLFNYSELLSFNQAMDDEPGRAWEPEELVAIGVAEEPYFAPGEGFHYSNTNTVLAGLLIEELTGNPLADEFEARIFEPLGLERSSLPAIDDASLPEPFAHGYLYGTNAATYQDLALPEDQRQEAEAGTLLPNDVTDLNPSWGWAAGAGISTAGDLADYVEALVGGGLLSDELQQERLDSLQSTDPDNPAAAGYGWALASFGPMLGHDGSMPGYQSFMGHDPERDLTLVVLTNLQASPGGVEPANEIARTLIGLLSETSAPEDDATAPD